MRPKEEIAITSRTVYGITPFLPQSKFLISGLLLSIELFKRGLYREICMRFWLVKVSCDFLPVTQTQPTDGVRTDGRAVAFQKRRF